jgi:hypothetical protein
VSAAAHAHVLDAAPSDGVALDEAPDEVRITFNEPVEVPTGGLRVLNTDATRVDDGAGEDHRGRRIPASDGAGHVLRIVGHAVGLLAVGSLVFGTVVARDDRDRRPARSVGVIGGLVAAKAAPSCVLLCTCRRTRSARSLADSAGGAPT